MEIYKEKGAEGNPSLSWTNGLTGFIHTPDHDSVGGINFESTADENVALPTTWPRHYNPRWQWIGYCPRNQS